MTTITNTDLRNKSIGLYTPPFRFEHGYIWDAKGQMVADNHVDGEDAALRIRGWGRISYMENPEALQDEVGNVIALAMTEFWERRNAERDSEPVIADCDPEVYEKGVSACLVVIPKETAEVICKGISAATGCKVDWHYIGGRVHIKALQAAPQPAPVVDSKPVAWTWHYREQWHVTNDEERARDLAWDDVKVEPLYRHAQPGPVVSGEVLYRLEHEANHITAWHHMDEHSCKVSRRDLLTLVSACRAAMLRAGNHTEQHLDMVDHFGDINEMAHVVTLASEGDIKVEPQNAQQNIPEIIPGWIPVSEQMPDCWCRTCRPVDINDMRFVVCPKCGNKRCPRANDHRNACTGSNEPGQEGSAYPVAPQEVKGE